MTQVHAKQAMFLGSLSHFWSGSAFGNPAVAPGGTLRRPLAPLCWAVTQPHPSARPRVTSLFVSKPLKVRSAVPPARVLLMCVAAAVVQALLKTWV